jgi:ATP-dependent RNA circularization protein (DNA/RNA ligase family)
MIFNSLGVTFIFQPIMRRSLKEHEWEKTGNEVQKRKECDKVRKHNT